MEETEELRHDIKRGECGWFLLLILAASKFAVTTGPVGYVPFPDDHACFISFTLWEVQTLASSPLGFAPPWLQLDWKRPVVWSPCISKNLVTRTCGRHMQMACGRSTTAVRSTLLPRRGAYKIRARCDIHPWVSMDALTWVLVGLVISVLEVHIKRCTAQRELLPGEGYGSRAWGEPRAA